MDKRKEILELSEEIIADFELKRISYQNIFLKCLRLCRLTNNEEGIKLFQYETSGYPRNENNKVTPDAWIISKIAGRHYFVDENGEKREYMKPQLIGELEKGNETALVRLGSTNDPAISISSSNPNQYVTAPIGNRAERKSLYDAINTNNSLIIKVAGHLYDYMLNIRNSIVYGDFIETTFEEYKKNVDIVLAQKCPDSIKRLSSAYDNIKSDNPQSWNNALHSCRRLIEDLADALYPAREPIEINGKIIELSKNKYKNRLVQYIKENSKSKTMRDIVTSSLEKICSELDSIYDSTNKGSHDDLTKDEAVRYLIHIYMLVSDIINL